MADGRSLLHDTDTVFFIASNQQSRLDIMRRANDLATVLVGQAITDQESGRRVRVVVGIDHEDKTVKQRRFYHAAVLPQISEQATVAGIRYTTQVWKEHFRRLYLHDRWASVRMPGAKRATPQRIRVSTEDLSIKQYSEHIDRVIAYGAADLGVVFRFRAEEREEVRWKAPKRAKQECMA
jgi:hypothetical protein